MGLFNFVSGWRSALIDKPLDARMTETLKVGLQVARDEVHVITGHLQASIGGEYRQSDKTIMLHADASYALIEETRGPTRRYSEHHYLAPAAQAMARVWGGNLELHFPNAHVPESVEGKTRQIHRITRFHAALGRTGRRTRVIVRRHRRLSIVPHDPTTPIL